MLLLLVLQICSDQVSGVLKAGARQGPHKDEARGAEMGGRGQQNGFFGALKRCYWDSKMELGGAEKGFVGLRNDVIVNRKL